MKRTEYALTKERIQAEYKKKLEALEIVWEMIGENDDLPANPLAHTEPERPTMGERIIEILPELDGDITQPVIYEILRARFSDVEERHKAYIAGVLTNLAKKDPPVLRLIRQARAGSPSVFRKAQEEAPAGS